MAEAKRVLERATDEAHAASGLTPVELDTANGHAAVIHRHEEALFSGKGKFRPRGRDLGAREAAVVERAVGAWTGETEAEKITLDLRAGRERLEQPQEKLEAQKADLERREADVSHREAIVWLRERYDQQEAKNKKTLANALKKQKEDTRSEYKQKLTMQETCFKERHKVPEDKCTGLAKQLELLTGSVEGAHSLTAVSEKAREGFAKKLTES